MNVWACAGCKARAVGKEVNYVLIKEGQIISHADHQRKNKRAHHKRKNPQSLQDAYALGQKSLVPVNFSHGQTGQPWHQPGQDTPNIDHKKAFGRTFQEIYDII